MARSKCHLGSATDNLDRAAIAATASTRPNDRPCAAPNFAAMGYLDAPSAPFRRSARTLTDPPRPQRSNQTPTLSAPQSGIIAKSIQPLFDYELDRRARQDV